MDLVAAHRRLTKRQSALGVDEGLVRCQGRFIVEPSETALGTHFALDAIGVMQRTPEHLHATADADDLAAIAQVPLKIAFPSVRPQPAQVTLHALAAGQYDEVGCRQGCARADILE